MDAQKFATILIRAVVDENLDLYRQLFDGTDKTDVTDEYWKDALSLFRNLKDRDKDTFFLVIRQTMVDTISNVLGIIDGINEIPEVEEDFRLLYGTSKKRLNGELQDHFLEADQSR